MATQTIKTIFQIRRGLSKEWWTANPVLRPGEPGMAIDTLEVKWGDGHTAWRDLRASNMEYIVDAPTLEDFPTIGQSNVLYKASQEKILYQWNDSLQTYETLAHGTVEASDLLVEIIDGGNADV